MLNCCATFTAYYIFNYCTTRNVQGLVLWPDWTDSSIIEIGHCLVLWRQIQSFRVSSILVRPVLCSFKWNNRRLWRMSKMEIIKGFKSWMKVGKTLEYWEWTNKKLFTLSLIKSSGFIFTIKWQLPRNSFPSRTNEWTNIFMPQLTLIASNCWIIIAIKSQTMRLHP